jgi:hypothetical protein
MSVMGFFVNDPGRSPVVTRFCRLNQRYYLRYALLLESSDKNVALTKYLSDHDEGIIGLSVEVADLGKARQLAESGTGRKLETYKGFYGTSFLLPPGVTHSGSNPV